VADYIPLLAQADPSRFGLALAALDGGLCGTGDDQERFSIQSISKVFALALTLPHLGEALWRRVGKEPSGNPFNSLVQLEYERGLPCNPFINAGALVVTDALLSLTGDASGTVLAFLQAQADPEQVAVDEDIAESEWQHRDRNAALAHFMKSFGNLHNPVDKVLRHYFRQCAIRMNCRQLARAGLFLANHGLCLDGRRLLTRSQAKQINAIMLTCGTYDAAGEFAYRSARSGHAVGEEEGRKILPLNFATGENELSGKREERPLRPCSELRAGGGAVLAQERFQLATLVDLGQLGEAADVAPGDEDLRHRRATARALHHLGEAVLVLRHVDVLEFNSLVAQERLGLLGIGAVRLRIERHESHGERCLLAPLPKLATCSRSARVARPLVCPSTMPACHRCMPRRPSFRGPVAPCDEHLPRGPGSSPAAHPL